MKFQSIVASVLTIACSFCVLTSRADHTASADDLGKEINVDGTLTVPSTINLQGQNVTYKGVTTIEWGNGATFENEGSLAELTIEHSGNVTQATAFSGAIKFIKDGAETWTFPKTSTFTGGIEINAGTVAADIGFSSYSLSSNHPFGTGTIIVNEGAILQVSRYTSWTCNAITLNGGTILNDKGRSNAIFLPTLTLENDSALNWTTGEYGIGSSITLNNHTLSIIAGGLTKWTATLNDSGAVELKSGTLTLTNACGSKDVDLIMGAAAKLEGNFDYTAKDLVFANGAIVDGDILVYGKYTLATTEGAYLPIMQEGSTLDLSGFEEIAQLDASRLAGKVTIDLGERKLTKNQEIISWSSIPTQKPVFTGTDTSFDADKFTISATGVIFDANTETAATAIWKVDANDGNLENVDNWTFKTAAGGDISVDATKFAEIKTSLMVTISGDISGFNFDGDFPFAGVIFENATLSENTTWNAAFKLTKISEASNIDVMGNTLTLTMGVDPFRVPVTSSEPNGALRIIVPEGTEFDNDGMNLTGALKLIKDGKGTMIASLYPAEFEDGTEILAGTLKCDIENMNAENGKSLFGANNTVIVTGGALDPAGSYNWFAQNIVLAGGQILNTVKRTGVATGTGTDKDFTSTSTVVGHVFNPKLTLETNAKFETTEDFNFQGALFSGGYALELSIQEGKGVLWNPTAATNANVTVTGSGTLVVWGKNPVTEAVQPGFNLTMSDAAALNLTARTTATITEIAYLHVDNYIANSTAVNAGGGVLAVNRTFTPNTDYFYGATLLNGAKIDLSAKTNTWSTTSVGGETLKFAEGAAITINLGERTLTKGDWIVTWDAEPNASFDFEGDNVDGEVETVKLDTGLRYGYPEAPHADWTGAVDGDLTNPANWKGDPTGIKAVFSGDISGLFVPADKSFTCGSIWFKDVKLEDNANLSWVDLSKLTDESVLDINGKAITLTASGVEATSAAKFTSIAQGGVVNFVVPAGNTYTNKTISFDGELKFVKQGEGILVAAKAQDYTGETEVEEGVLVTGIESINADDTPFGKGFKVVIDENGLLDAAGSYGWVDYTIDMNGGTITNTIDRAGLSGQNPGASSTLFNTFAPTLNLLKNSLITTTNRYNFCGTIIANGNELELSIGYGQKFMWHPVSATNLTLNVVSKGGYFETMKTPIDYAAQTNMIFKCNAALDLLASTSGAGNTGGMPVKDYYALYSSKENTGTGDIYVYGTFYPVDEKYFRGCVMMDGSTICLTNKTSVWSTTSKSNAAAGVPKTVTFADDATVTIDVHGRSFGGKNKKIVSWTEETKPANLNGLTFVLDAESKRAGYKLEWDDDGIYAKHLGIIMMLK